MNLKDAETLKKNINAERLKILKPSKSIVPQDQNKSSHNDSQAQEWGNPISFDEHSLPPFPVDVYPEWLRRYVEESAEETQTPIDIQGTYALAILSTAIAKKFYIKLQGNYSEQLNLFVLITAETGSRKSAVFKHFLKPIQEYEKDENERLKLEVKHCEDQIQLKEKELEHVKNLVARGKADPKEIVSIREELESIERITAPQFITGDITPERLIELMQENDGRMSLHAGEPKIFDNLAGLYSDGKSNFDHILSAFTGEMIRVDRMNRTGYIELPALTMGIFGQPSKLQKLPQEFKDRGLNGRFLYCIPETKVGYRKVESKPLSEVARTAYYRFIKSLMRLPVPEYPADLFLSNEAYDVYIDYAKRNEAGLREGGYLHDIKDWGAKAVGHAARIAGLLHVAEQAEITNGFVEGFINAEIKADTFEKAVRLIDYFTEHTKAVYGVMGANEEAEDAKYLLRVIKRQNKETVEYRDIQMLTRKKFQKTQHLKETLSELEDRDFIRKRKNGRKTVYDVNPYILSNKSTHNTHSMAETLPQQEKQRGNDIPTKNHNTHNKNNNLNVGNGGERGLKGTTLETLERHGIANDVGNVGKNQTTEYENNDDEDLII